MARSSGISACWPPDEPAHGVRHLLRFRDIVKTLRRSGAQPNLQMAALAGTLPDQLAMTSPQAVALARAPCIRLEECRAVGGLESSQVAESGFGTPGPVSVQALDRNPLFAKIEQLVVRISNARNSEHRVSKAPGF